MNKTPSEDITAEGKLVSNSRSLCNIQGRKNMAGPGRWWV